MQFVHEKILMYQKKKIRKLLMIGNNIYIKGELSNCIDTQNISGTSTLTTAIK